jgi:hypothetical protein
MDRSIDPSIGIDEKQKEKAQKLKTIAYGAALLDTAPFVTLIVL